MCNIHQFKIDVVTRQTLKFEEFPYGISSEMCDIPEGIPGRISKGTTNEIPEGTPDKIPKRTPYVIPRKNSDVSPQGVRGGIYDKISDLQRNS